MKNYKRIKQIATTAAGWVVGMTAGAVLFAGVGMALLTPEKTPAGQFTQPIKYWFDDAYFEREFINAAKPDTVRGCATDSECDACGFDCQYNY